jgi:hypothetical protein
VCKITFTDKEQLDAFKDKYEEALKAEFNGITFSVSGGEL